MTNKKKVKKAVKPKGTYIDIDKVTTQYLELGLRMCGIQLPMDTVDKIIDVVELIGKKGGNASILDTCKLMEEWKKVEKTWTFDNERLVFNCKVTNT